MNLLLSTRKMMKKTNEIILIFKINLIRLLQVTTEMKLVVLIGVDDWPSVNW